MMGKNDKLETVGKDAADVLLTQLLHLKSYETPDAVRMTKSRQNILRQVREESLRERWSLGDLLEVNIPWFFAEPRYGIAALFIAFAALQFWGVSSQKQLPGKTGIYMSEDNLAGLNASASLSTNSISYPKLPDGLELFPSQRGANDVKFVGRLEQKK
jgi:hypothetical protein